jgi:hypothetical protein
VNVGYGRLVLQFFQSPQHYHNNNNNMNGSSSREVLHVSIGPEANHVTAHLLNLYGLSVTPSFDNVHGALCDPRITHDVWDRLYVPRVVLVDTPDSRLSRRNPTAATPLPHVPVGSHDTVAPFVQPTSVPIPIPDPAWTALHDTAQFLVQSPYSRYRVRPVPHSGASHHRSDHRRDNRSGGDRVRHYANARHVDWDDWHDDEADEEQRANERTRQQACEQRERQSWQQQTLAPAQEQLESFWKSVPADKAALISTLPQHQTADARIPTKTTATQADALPVSPICPDAVANSRDETTNATTMPTPTLSWRDYWMPPYHPQSCLALPVSHQSNIVSDWDSYIAGSSQSNASPLQSWKDDVLWERIRRQLEACESVQGVVLATTDRGLYAGLSSGLLETFQEECATARRLVLALEHEPSLHHSYSDEDHQSTKSSWQVQQVERLRSRVEKGLFYHDMGQNADVVLPLRIPTTDETRFANSNGTNSSDGVFAGAARMAAALETALLGFRVAKSTTPSRSRIGLNSSYYYGALASDSPFGTTPQLSMSEFLSTLRPSSRHSVLELDTVLPNTNVTHEFLWQSLLEGTTVERDHRMRQRGITSLSGVRRPRDVDPGAWMLDAAPDMGKDGLLSSLSLAATTPNITDRSLHHHFSLSTSMRTHPPTSASQADYINCTMQGMGIRFRPEQSTAMIVTQTLGTLTADGYGAGSYWPAVWGSPSCPVLSVVGNTSRSFATLQDTAQSFQQALAPRSRGYYNRDVTNGVLPEPEDCEDALASCLDLADVYRPPEGSGLVPDEDLDSGMS